MADDVTPDSMAHKWFIITIVGALLYVTASFTFVINDEVTPTNDVMGLEQHD